MYQTLKKSKKLVAWLLGLTLTTTAIVEFSVVANGADKQPFSVLQQTKQKEGEIVLKGSNGQYTGHVVVRGTQRAAWSVLTDYDNFERYMPNVIESKLLQSSGNRKVFEQVQLFQLVLVSRRARVKIVVTENPPNSLKFKVVEGEVKALEGGWQIKPLAANLFLISHQVSVEPDIKSSINRRLFYSVYEDTLENTFAAIRQEIAQRSKVN